ncbi:hypothetical protein, partial [Meiothermus hypogaeus]|uniref:hypothetical protein n=1 Tax=Meiothermus hypogaeus TaxID=884155 RepID=UPI0019816985
MTGHRYDGGQGGQGNSYQGQGFTFARVFFGFFLFRDLWFLCKRFFCGWLWLWLFFFFGLL